jgi:hypothetical protein
MTSTHPALPADQEKTLRRAIRIEWFALTVPPTNLETAAVSGSGDR